MEVGRQQELLGADRAVEGAIRAVAVTGVLVVVG